MDIKTKLLEACMIEGIDINELLLRLSNFSTENDIINFSSESFMIPEVIFLDSAGDNWKYSGNNNRLYRFYLKFREKKGR